MIKKIDHFVITAKDPKKTVAFYQSLGFAAKDLGGRHELYAGDFKINVHTLGKELLPHAACVKAGSADFCLEVTGSLDELAATLAEKGIAMETNIVARHGVNGEMNSVYLRDPDGNLVELSSYQI